MVGNPVDDAAGMNRGNGADSPARLRSLIESAAFQNTITGLIVINAVILGLLTVEEIDAVAGHVLIWLDSAILAVFVGELLAKIAVYRSRFHKDPWNLFDFVVVGIALIPSGGPLAVLRSLRVLRVLRLVSAIPSMRRVVTGLLQAIPGMGSVIALLLLVFYVFSVMTTQLYGETFPQYFGSIGESAYTLFQIMTLESWSHGIVRPVMAAHPFAWMLFVPFILVTSFTVLNLFIAIIVSAVGEQNQATEQEELAEITRIAEAETAQLQAELQAMRGELREIRALLARSSGE